MYASLIAAITQAALVTVTPGPSENCPSSAQVLSALETHAPNLVAPRPDNDPAGQFTLVLSPALQSGEVSFFLMDKGGRMKLYRTLPPPTGDPARDCPAFADTVAFIIDRYFNEVELPSLPERTSKPEPTPAEPPQGQVTSVAQPRFSPEAANHTFSFSAGRRMPGSAEDLGGDEFKLAGGQAVAGFGQRGGRLWLETSAGIVGIVDLAWPQDSVNAVTAGRAAWDLSVLLGWPVWHGRLSGGASASLEYIWLDATSAGHHQHETRLGSTAGLRAGYLLFLSDHVFVRMDLGGNLAILRHEFTTQSSAKVLLTAPPAYVTAAIGIGISF